MTLVFYQLRIDQRFLSGHMELYFSLNPIPTEDIDIVEPGKKSAASQALYRKNNIYGDHSYLIPSKKVIDGQYEAPYGSYYIIEKIGGDPTTATLHERLQLLPCRKSNFELFKEKVMTDDFYFELNSTNFFLHILDKNKRYVSIPAQNYSPRCWHGFARPAVTLNTQLGSECFSTFSEIPWSEIAEQLYK